MRQSFGSRVLHPISQKISTAPVFVDTITHMISWDEAKRQKTLLERGLDFAQSAEVFSGLHATRTDDRKDYGEVRYITAGWLRERFVVLVWTPRDGGQRIISMRHGHDDEERAIRRYLDRSR